MIKNEREYRIAERLISAAIPSLGGSFIRRRRRTPLPRNQQRCELPFHVLGELRHTVGLGGRPSNPETSSGWPDAQSGSTSRNRLPHALQERGVGPYELPMLSAEAVLESTGRLKCVTHGSKVTT
jgi:hypothetical protein